MKKDNPEERDKLSNLAQDLIIKKQEIKIMKKINMDNDKFVKSQHETVQLMHSKSKHYAEII